MALDLGMVIGDTGPTGPTGPTGDTGAVGATGPANSSYGVCSTAAGVDNKEVEADGFELVNGVVVHVLMNYNNTYSGQVLLDVNHTGGYPIYINNTVTSASNKAAWFAGDVVSFVFDDVNDRWQMLNTTTTMFSMASVVLLRLVVLRLYLHLVLCFMLDLWLLLTFPMLILLLVDCSLMLIAPELEQCIIAA